MKGVPFGNRRYNNYKGVPCLSKMVHIRVRGWTSRAESTRIKLFLVLPRVLGIGESTQSSLPWGGHAQAMFHALNC